MTKDELADEVERVADRATDLVVERLQEFRGFRAREDLLEEMPGIVREAVLAALRNQGEPK